jgi:UDPglucose 6-dehydrogenase
MAEAVRDADYVFIAFDTPVDAQDRSNLVPLETALTSCISHFKTSAIVVVSSQVPVGTCRRWRAQIQAAAPASSVDVVYSPENLRLGDAIACYRSPDRVVVGVDDDQTKARIARLFEPIGAPIHFMSIASAEMTKHALNGFLATSVSFINEIASLCEVAGADVLAVADAMKSDARIGPRAFLSPGFGFAGGTLARDVQALRDLGRQHGRATRLLESVLSVNAARPMLLLDRLGEVYDDIRGLTVGVLGLTYKAGTSTLRRSVSLEVIKTLTTAGARVRAYDPKADLNELDGDISFEIAADAYAAAHGAGALAILTEWPEFAALDFDRIRSTMARPLIFDGKNLLAGLGLGHRGFEYKGIGR